MNEQNNDPVREEVERVRRERIGQPVNLGCEDCGAVITPEQFTRAGRCDNCQAAVEASWEPPILCDCKREHCDHC